MVTHTDYLWFNTKARQEFVRITDEVAAVVLETDGTFSVVSSRGGGRLSLEDVYGEN